MLVGWSISYSESHCCELDNCWSHWISALTFQTGWGHTEYGGTSSDKLMKVTLNLVEFNECKKKILESSDLEITENQLCAYAKNADTCQGGLMDD